MCWLFFVFNSQKSLKLSVKNLEDMKKQQKRKKLSPKTKRNSDDFVVESNLIQPIPEPQFERKSILLQLAENPNFNGAIWGMLKGIFVGSGLIAIIAILFAVPDLGRLFAMISYQIVSFIPKKFIPPGTFIPGVFFIFVWLLIIIGFAVRGYKKGGTPLKIKIEKDTRSLVEKLFEFVFILAIALVVGYFKIRPNDSELDFVQIILNPMFLIFTTIITLGITFYVFSRHQNQQFLLFVLYSALPIGFVLFLLGLLGHTIIKSFLYALTH